MNYRPIVAMGAFFALSSSVLTIAQTSPSAPVYQASSITCPIGSGCTGVRRSDPFGPRTHPVTGEKGKMHWGVDFAIPSGTPIVAASDGIVERSALSSSLGNVVYIRHTDGSATVYAHLDRGVVELGTPQNPTRITAGQQIGFSDGEAGNPGRGTSTGAHLHFEYVRAGEIYQSPLRVDPDACIGNAVNGSINIRDNGNVADDAFQISVDGIDFGRTDIGLPKPFAINGLRPGQHELVVTAIIAPDNQGTLEITLSNGWTFLDGRTLISDVLMQGQAKPYKFIVPGN